jgi:hypothetical protein
MARLPPRYNAYALPLVVTGVMTLVVAAISTLRAIGFAPSFVSTWLSAWLLSWMVAFPVMVLIMPMAKRAVALIVEPPRG